jgi:hypothetical protein
MSDFYTPNFATFKNWSSTATVITSQLRKKKFATDDTFTWKTFNPELNYGGMTVTAQNIAAARYCTVNKVLFFHLSFACTLAGVAAQIFNATLPGTTPINIPQGNTLYIYNIALPVAPELGYWLVYGASNTITMFRQNYTAYPAGTYLIMAGGSIEVV